MRPSQNPTLRHFRVHLRKLTPRVAPLPNQSPVVLQDQARHMVSGSGSPRQLTAKARLKQPSPFAELAQAFITPRPLAHGQPAKMTCAPRASPGRNERVQSTMRSSLVSTIRVLKYYLI